MWTIWIVIGIVLIIAEMFTPGFFLALIGLACLAAGAVAVFTNGFFLSFLVFSVVSVLLLLLLRPVCVKYFYKGATSSNVDALIGKEFLVETTINNDLDQGYIKSNADYWKARSLEQTVIEKGERVRVDKVEGATVYVKKVKN